MTEITNVEVDLLPDEQKQQLCLELLDEFGAGHVRVKGHELRHNCTLNLGGHNDNNSYAASVNYHSLQFNCYVCGYGGSLAWWIAVNRRENTDTIEPWLKKRLGIGTSLPLHDLMRVIDAICHPSSESVILPHYPKKLLDRWTDWGMYHPYLTDPISEHGRAIPEETLEKYSIGYADNDKDFEYYQRIILPCFWDDKLVGWQARRLSSEDPHPEKYLNSVGFPRDSILYGDISARRALLVESNFSVLRHSHAIPVISTLGSNISPRQFRLLEKFDELIICNENDKAGWKMTRAVERNLSRKVRLYSWVNPYRDVDPADLETDDLMNLVDNALPISVWEPVKYAAQQTYIRSKKE